MDTHEVEYYVLKGLISEMSASDKEIMEECYAKMTDLINEYGDNGFIALSLVGFEHAGRRGWVKPNRCRL